MRYVISLAASVTALVVMAAIGFGSSATPVSAAPVTIQGVATGAEEVPAVAGAGSVQVRFTFDEATNKLTFNATVGGISPEIVTAAHIHRGARGVNGPIVHNLSTTSFSTIGGTITLSDADVADLKAGNFYFNAHSTVNPGGFARFQIVLPSAPAPVPTARIAPPATGDAGLAEKPTSMLLPIVAGMFLLSGMGALAFARSRAG